MTVLGFIEQVIIPAFVIFMLVGSVGGALLGLALALRSAAALRFVARMNRWVSTRRALRPVEIPRSLEGAPGAAHKRWLGVLLLVGSVAALYMLLARLQLPATPGIDLRRWLVAGLALQATKWFLLLGAGLSLAVAILLLFFPRAYAAFEARMNYWYSTRKLLPADSDSMHQPLESMVEAYPRGAGWLIFAASLVVAVAMTALLGVR
jgi:hypothetical protein